MSKKELSDDRDGAPPGPTIADNRDQSQEVPITILERGGKSSDDSTTTPEMDEDEKMASPADDSSLTISSASNNKPGKPYSVIIEEAIKSKEEGQMILAEIYDYIRTHYPFYKTAGTGWKNSVRHNLSLNPKFLKVARPNSESGKGSYWRLVELPVDFAKNGGLRGRRRSRSKSLGSSFAQQDYFQQTQQSQYTPFKNRMAPYGLPARTRVGSIQTLHSANGKTLPLLLPRPDANHNDISALLQFANIAPYPQQQFQFSFFDPTLPIYPQQPPPTRTQCQWPTYQQPPLTPPSLRSAPYSQDSQMSNEYGGMMSWVMGEFMGQSVGTPLQAKPPPVLLSPRDRTGLSGTSTDGMLATNVRTPPGAFYGIPQMFSAE